MNDRIISFANDVFHALGPGYSERIYQNALEVCFRENNIPYETERIIPVIFHNHVIGNIRADIVVSNSIVLELKAVACINNSIRNQANTYLHMTGLKTAIILNFQQSVESVFQFEIINV